MWRHPIKLSDYGSETPNHTATEPRNPRPEVCDGSAMFVRQSAMNHSCDPSTVATYPANNACVEIVATRMIPEGEEITMCYVEGLQEEDVPTEQRQAELRGYYLFSCACRRCKDDGAGGSSDGSDDSE